MPEYFTPKADDGALGRSNLERAVRDSTVAVGVLVVIAVALSFFGWTGDRSGLSRFFFSHRTLFCCAA